MRKIQNTSFKCINCGKQVAVINHIGTAHRNHCPFCLWSRHVDQSQEGDRKSSCQAGMKPIGLTFKKEKPDKYHLEEKGELMLVHRCSRCGKVSLNRVAADDETGEILKLLKKSKGLNEEDCQEVQIQLFGKDK